MDVTIKIPLAADAMPARERALALAQPPAPALELEGIPDPDIAPDPHPPPNPIPPPNPNPNLDRGNPGEEDPPDPRRPGWAQIEATLEFAAREKRNHYAPLGAYQAVLPIVMTSGGTLHKDAHRLLKDMFPCPFVRSRVRIDISLALVRGRAKAYSLQ